MDGVMTGDPSLQYKAKKADCEGRIHDNKSTHFQFGSDSERKRTEQVVFCCLNVNFNLMFCDS